MAETIAMWLWAIGILGAIPSGIVAFTLALACPQSAALEPSAAVFFTFGLMAGLGMMAGIVTSGGRRQR